MSRIVLTWYAIKRANNKCHIHSSSFNLKVSQSGVADALIKNVIGKIL